MNNNIKIPQAVLFPIIGTLIMGSVYLYSMFYQFQVDENRKSISKNAESIVLLMKENTEDREVYYKFMTKTLVANAKTLVVNAEALAVMKAYIDKN